MASISFKSVGKLASDLDKQIIDNATITRFGIKTPMQLGNDTMFATNNSALAQMNDNLRNLVQTNWGDRVGRYFFGANLRELVTERVAKEDFDEEAISRISNAVNTWMPYVNLDNFESNVDREKLDGNTLIKIKITYYIPQISSLRQGLEVTLYAI